MTSNADDLSNYYNYANGEMRSHAKKSIAKKRSSGGLSSSGPLRKDKTSSERLAALRDFVSSGIREEYKKGNRKGFRKDSIFQYKCEDPNPLNNIMAYVFYFCVTKWLPKYIRPNHLTITTLILSLVMYFTLAYYDWSLDTSSWELMHGKMPIPRWVWLMCGLILLISIVLDTVDGQLARDRNCMTILGSILDHSIDCWRLCMPLLIVLFSLFGSTEYGIPPRAQVTLIIGAQAVGIFSFIVQTTSHIFYYTCSSDIAQYATAALVLYTSTKSNGAGYWQCDAWFWGTNANAVKTFIFYVPIGISLLQLINYAVHSWSVKTMRDSLLNQNVYVPILYLATSTIALELNNITMVMLNQPRLYQWILAIACSQITWPLLVAYSSRGLVRAKPKPLISLLILIAIFACFHLYPGYCTKTIRMLFICGLYTFFHIYTIFHTIQQLI